MRRTHYLTALLFPVFALLAALPGCSPRVPAEKAPEGPASKARKNEQAASSGRPARWAQPVERPGLPNLHKVSGDLYRGAQPEKEGYAQLKALGVKTIVNLRSLHGESGSVQEEGLSYEHIYFEPWKDPKNPELVRFLRIMADQARTPVFVHCQHGADRTGTMCAVYRIAVQGWSKEDAIREMKEGGFGFHVAFYEGYAKYIEQLDLEAVRKAAGLPK